MYQSSIDLPENTRFSSSVLLNARLSDLIDLAAMLKHAHWNIRRPQFIALHLLFEELHCEVADKADLVAERIASFGGSVCGLIQQAVLATTVPAYPPDANSERSHLDALSSALAGVGSRMRAVVQETTDTGDVATADIFTEILRATDKQLWKIDAHFRPAG